VNTARLIGESASACSLLIRAAFVRPFVIVVVLSASAAVVVAVAAVVVVVVVKLLSSDVDVPLNGRTWH
jgi:hypothetical protein